MLNIDMNSIFYLFASNELKLFSLRIKDICSNSYMYKMKLVFKSQYTNYLFEDLLFTINAVLPLLKNFINFWSITMDIAKYLKLCILAYINIPTPSALENFSVFIRHSFNVRHRFFIALLTRQAKSWKNNGKN